MSTRTTERRDQNQVEGLGWIIPGLALFVLGCWLLPVTICLLRNGEVPPLTIPSAVSAVGRLVADGHLANPADAYPIGVRRTMPDAGGWWLGALWCFACCGATGAALMRHVEPQIARERLGRRAWDWRGSRPRPWGRPRDLRQPDADRRGWSVGRLDGRPIWTDEEAHIAVIAPTRAGKTTRCVIPWLLEHEGPAIVTSTKRDVLEATRAHRARLGSIWIFDPFNKDRSTWTPLIGCDNWSFALRQAQWLGDASSDGNNEIARFWRGEAAKLLAPLLHAAGLARLHMTDVLRWVDTQNLTQASQYLLAARSHAAKDQLTGIEGLDDRNKGTTYMSASAVLAAYRYPEVRAASGDDITVEEFLTHPAHTLYVVAAERHQRLLAPLVVSLISSMVNGVAEAESNGWGGGRLRVLLDEAANVAPLSDLPRMLSQGAGHAIRFATIWQSIAQLEERHGVAAHTVLANSTAKLLMGPVGDDRTRRMAEQMLARGESPRSGPGIGSDNSAAMARSLTLLRQGRAVAQISDRLPAVVDLEPYWHNRSPIRLSRVGGS